MTERKCPDCGERLSLDAMRCACGWGMKKFEKGHRSFDHRCTYLAGNARCEYPVGMFAEGATSGWCIFHRQHLNQADGAEAVRQSQTVPYLDAIRGIQDTAKHAPGVVSCAMDIARRHGNKPWQAGNEQFLSDAARGNEEAA